MNSLKKEGEWLYPCDGCRHQCNDLLWNQRWIWKILVMTKDNFNSEWKKIFLMTNVFKPVITERMYVEDGKDQLHMIVYTLIFL